MGELFEFLFFKTKTDYCKYCGEYKMCKKVIYDSSGVGYGPNRHYWVCFECLDYRRLLSLKNKEKEENRLIKPTKEQIKFKGERDKFMGTINNNILRDKK